MASYAEDKWSHSSTIDLLLRKTMCIVLMTDSFIMTCGKGKDSFIMMCGKGTDSNHYDKWERNR